VKTLLEAIALVTLVVFIFLQSWRATLIPLLTIPVSLVGAFLVPVLFVIVARISRRWQGEKPESAPSRTTSPADTTLSAPKRAAGGGV
jgi:fatty acid desaturase